MTELQKQLILCYYDCLDAADIDGVWGAKSAQATRKLQQLLGIPDDGIWGKQTESAVREIFYSGESLVKEQEKEAMTGTFWDEIEFFDREEFRCQCGGKYCNGFPVEPQEEMVRTVNEIRRRLGVPVTIVDSGGSGVRCPQHNANVGGVPNSLHITGNAADLHSSKSPEEMAAAAESVMGSTGEIGVYSWGIHVGIGKYSRFRG